MDLGLTGRVAIVAAASKGLGRAVAEELAREGARVAICERTASTLAETAAGIGNADINTAEPGFHIRSEGSNSSRISHIQRLIEDFLARGFLNVGGGFSERTCRSRADSDTGAFAGEFFRDGASQPFAGRCDNGHAARKP